MQKVLCVSTCDDNLRSTIDGWGWEDGDLVHQGLTELPKYNKLNIPVGLIRSGNIPCYPTVLHAIGDGWKLLAPPTKFSYTTHSDGPEITGYSWWLVKD